MSLFEAHNLPFAVAAALLVLIAVMQVIGLGDIFGSSDAEIDFDLDGDFGPEVEAAGSMDGLLSLIGLGKVPFLIWLALLLAVFLGVGVSGQALAQSLLGAPLHPGVAGILAGIAALPVNGLAVRPVAAILPEDETSAVGRGSLLSRRAVIQTGKAEQGSPARAKVTDRYGQPHFVMVEPHDAGIILGEGEEVVLVRRESGVFYGVLPESRLLTIDR